MYTIELKQTPPKPPASELFEAALWEASYGGKPIGEGWRRTVLARLEKNHDEKDVKTWERWKQHHEQLAKRLAERDAELAVVYQTPVEPVANIKGDKFRDNTSYARKKKAA